MCVGEGHSTHSGALGKKNGFGDGPLPRVEIKYSSVWLPWWWDPKASPPTPTTAGLSFSHSLYVLQDTCSSENIGPVCALCTVWPHQKPESPGRSCLHLRVEAICLPTPRSLWLRTGKALVSSFFWVLPHFLPPARAPCTFLLLYPQPLTSVGPLLHDRVQVSAS